jgi:hypothetical protein
MKRTRRAATLLAISFAATSLAACGMFSSPSTRSTGDSRQVDDNPEVHRGLVNNQKSSPDSGQAPAGDGLGGGRGAPGR